jgi:hypothetical protein
VVFYIGIVAFRRDFGRAYSAKRISRHRNAELQSRRQGGLAADLIKTTSTYHPVWQELGAEIWREAQDRSESFVSHRVDVSRIEPSFLNRSVDKLGRQIRILVSKVEPRNNFSAFCFAFAWFPLPRLSKFLLLPGSLDAPARSPIYLPEQCIA